MASFTYNPGPTSRPSRVSQHLYFISEGRPGLTMAQVRDCALESDLSETGDIESIHDVLSVQIPCSKFLNLLTVAQEGDVSDEAIPKLLELVKRLGGGKNLQEPTQVQIPAEMFDWLVWKAYNQSAPQIRGFEVEKRFEIYSQGGELNLDCAYGGFGSVNIQGNTVSVTQTQFWPKKEMTFTKAGFKILITACVTFLFFFLAFLAYLFSKLYCYIS